MARDYIPPMGKKEVMVRKMQATPENIGEAEMLIRKLTMFFGIPFALRTNPHLSDNSEIWIAAAKENVSTISLEFAKGWVSGYLVHRNEVKELLNS